MKCPTCNVGMKPLFVGFYCPNDCDKATSTRRPKTHKVSHTLGWRHLPEKVELTEDPTKLALCPFGCGGKPMKVGEMGNVGSPPFGYMMLCGLPDVITGGGPHWWSIDI